MRSFFVVIFLCAAGSVVPAKEPVISKEAALKAASLFRNSDPYSEDARGCAGILVRFTDQSPEVLIGIGHKALPFLSNKNLTVQENAILIGAFLAGNVDSQLLRRKKKDDPYAGDLQVIETYTQMRNKKPRLSVPEIENLIALEKAGKLRAYLAAK